MFDGGLAAVIYCGEAVDISSFTTATEQIPDDLASAHEAPSATGKMQCSVAITIAQFRIRARLKQCFDTLRYKPRDVLTEIKSGGKEAMQRCETVAVELVDIDPDVG